MATSSTCAVACFVAVLSAHVAGSLAAAQFIAGNIVEDVTTCPVTGKPWDASIFDANNLGQLGDILTIENGVTKACADSAVTDLALCSLDGSFATVDGCCSKTCAEGIAQASSSGCLKQYAAAICTTSLGKKFAAGLFNGAKRCVNQDVACEVVKPNVTPPAKATPAPSPKPAPVALSPPAQPKAVPAVAPPPVQAAASPVPEPTTQGNPGKPTNGNGRGSVHATGALALTTAAAVLSMLLL